MQTFIASNQEEFAQQTADFLFQRFVQKPDLIVALAAGETPLLPYTRLVERLIRERVDISRCTFVALDEWVGIPPDNPGSCSYFLHNVVLDPLKIKSDRFKLFNSQAPDLQQECRNMDAFILSRGVLDAIVVGIGMNGHIGFNEPGVSSKMHSHVIDLDANTQNVGQKYFAQHTTLSKGITLGLQTLMDAKQAILLANGARKASIMRKALEGPLSIEVPASIMQQHANGFIFMDEAAAGELTMKQKGS